MWPVKNLSALIGGKFLNAVISTNESTRFITAGHMVYNLGSKVRTFWETHKIWKKSSSWFVHYQVWTLHTYNDQKWTFKKEPFSTFYNFWRKSRGALESPNAKAEWKLDFAFLRISSPSRKVRKPSKKVFRLSGFNACLFILFIKNLVEFHSM